MEVAPLLISSQAIYNELEKYLLAYPYLDFDYKNDDTMYFNARDTGRHEIYYHFKNDIGEEFSFNFEPEILREIYKFFGGKQIILLYFSFKRHSFFFKFLNDFVNYAINERKLDIKSDVLLLDPFDGMFRLNSDGKFYQ